MLKITDISCKESVDDLRALAIWTRKERRNELIIKIFEACKRERPGEKVESIICDIASWFNVSASTIYRVVLK